MALMAGAFGAEFYQYVPLPLGGGGGRGEGESQSARFTVILRAEPVFRGASLRARIAVSAYRPIRALQARDRERGEGAPNAIRVVVQRFTLSPTLPRRGGGSDTVARWGVVRWAWECAVPNKHVPLPLFGASRGIRGASLLARLAVSAYRPACALQGRGKAG